MFNIVLFIKNFLVVIYEFKQVCQFCYFKIGFWVGDYIYCEGFEYKCKWDILFGWFWSLEDQIWKWIWFWFIKISFVGFYYLCKDMINKQDCKYGDNCIFVYYQEEIDVWIEEWKGIFNCDLFFDLLGGVKCGSFIIVKFLKEYQGIFIFFCEVLFVYLLLFYRLWYRQGWGCFLVWIIIGGQFWNQWVVEVWFQNQQVLEGQ